MTKRFFNYFSFLSAVLCCAAFTGCMAWDYGKTEELESAPSGLFIVNEGNFQYGNATLSFYNPADKSVENNIFYRANGMKLGDVAQSMTIHGGRGWIVVNNSHLVFAIDLDTYKETGRITDLTSPRYIHFVSDTKAYVTQLWDNRIFIVNPKTYQVTGYITVPDMKAGTGSTEQMVQLGKYVYCNCWSYQNTIIRIDTETDAVDAVLEVGIQPTSIVLDRNNKLWTVTDGGYEGSPYGYEQAALVKIDTESFTVERRFRFSFGEHPSEIVTDGTRSHIYWLNDDVWQMDVSADALPATPVISSGNTKYYGLTVSPADGDIYVADAVDYQQAGMIYRYSAEGVLQDSFYAGVTPGAFCWK